MKSERKVPPPIIWCEVDKTKLGLATQWDIFKRDAIVVCDEKYAILFLFINCFYPGIGTALSGFESRFSYDNPINWAAVSMGAMQCVTTSDEWWSLGWIWALYTSYELIQTSKFLTKHLHEKHQAANP